MADPAERLFDEYLAASARAGSRIALEQLAARFHPRLLGHARRLTGDPDAARDAVQEAWIEILRGLHRLDDPAAFPAWAFRIVSRRCARWVRRVQRRRRMDAGYASEPREAATANEGERAWEASRLAHAMRALPPEQHAAMALFYLEDLSVAEISVALGVPPGKLRRSLTVKETDNE
jgi:RNA polymerase sigma factor (sigma-70 family)